MISDMNMPAHDPTKIMEKTLLFSFSPILFISLFSSCLSHVLLTLLFVHPIVTYPHPMNNKRLFGFSILPKNGKR
jgi:hypothetical protein